MDPWEKCKIIYDTDQALSHFESRAILRSFDFSLTRDILVNGAKQADSKKSEFGQNFRVSKGDWCLNVTLGKCTITCWTVYHP